MTTITNKIENFVMNVNPEFIRQAEKLAPALIHQRARPQAVVELTKENGRWRVRHTSPLENSLTHAFAQNEARCFDFGDHQVGRLGLSFNAVGSPPDAPAYIRIKFGETLEEIGEDFDDYQGEIGAGWLQQEFIHIDDLPSTLRLPRRYAFRYVEIKVLATSPKYRLLLEDMVCNTESAVDMEDVSPPGDDADEELRRIDRIALRTMQNCMQSVFEDGPKRDRRLWIGDLRLQALTNYETFKHNDLVKRCLYLFAGLTQNEGRVGACLFHRPELQVDDTALFDYSLFFISCLYDYYQSVQDLDCLKALWETAYRQAELAMERVDANGVVEDRADWWCFLDWHPELNKQAGAQGVLIYALKQALQLAQVLGDTARQQKITAWIARTSQGARNHLWDEDKGLFISGADRQISWASQVWLVLAKVFSQEKNQKILTALMRLNPAVNMITPYMHHHFVDALLQNAMEAEAFAHIRYYWGGMAREGADCFWELYDPEHRTPSPYGSTVIQSYCHAWSCTPAYFMRKYRSR